MAKSKNKSSILRSVQRDFRLHASRQTFASRMPRAQSHSRSPVLQDLMSPSDQAFTPPGTRVVFADLAGSPREARISSKRRNRAMQKNSPSAQSSSSPASCERNDSSFGSTRPSILSREHSGRSNPGGSYPGSGERQDSLWKSSICHHRHSNKYSQHKVSRTYTFP